MQALPGSRALHNHGSLVKSTSKVECHARCCVSTSCGRRFNLITVPDMHSNAMKDDIARDERSECSTSLRCTMSKSVHAASLASALFMIPGAAVATELVQRVSLDDVAASPAGVAAAGALAEGSKYVPSPYEPGWEIWIGSLAGVIPFAIGSYEFGKRIIIQLRCELCAGKGLVPSTNAGAKYLRKCPECGGFFPWISWKMFLSSAAAPGNGGPLQQPKGQSSVFYSVPDKAPTKEQIQAAREKYMSQGQSSASSEAEGAPEEATSNSNNTESKQ